MPTRTLAAAFALGAMTAVTPAVAGTAGAPPCILNEYAITSVRPYRVETPVGKASIKKLLGAEIAVRAEPGLTAEWLRLRLARHVAEMQHADMTDCVLDVEDVTIDVDSTGTGFIVKVIAKSSERAEEVLRRARLLAS